MRHNTGSGFKKPRMQKINVFYRNKTILDHLKHDPDTQQYLCIYRSRLFEAEIYYRLRILRIRAREFHIEETLPFIYIKRQRLLYLSFFFKPRTELYKGFPLIKHITILKLMHVL